MEWCHHILAGPRSSQLIGNLRSPRSLSTKDPVTKDVTILAGMVSVMDNL